MRGYKKLWKRTLKLIIYQSVLFDAKHIGSFGVHSHDGSVAQLKHSIDEVTEGYSELMTHVGYSDDYLREHSSYSDPREEELRSVCSPEIKQYIQEQGLVLVTWASIAV